MAKTWEKWFDEVLPDVPGCSQAVAKNAIRNAAIEFFQRSWTWRADHDPINAVADQAAYDYAPPVGAKVAMPLKVWYEQKPLTPITFAELEALYQHWPSQVGTPLYFIQEDLEKLTLVPYPSASVTAAITLKVALKPSRVSASIDDVYWEKYLEEIATGAKAKLFAMRKKPWTDTDMAVGLMALFGDQIAKAKLAADRGRVKARLRVQAHFF
jgi:hypothetical protein